MTYSREISTIKVFFPTLSSLRVGFLFSNGIIICFGYAVMNYTVLPTSYQQFYVITFGQADLAASAKYGRSIWFTSNKSLTQFQFHSSSTTTYLTVGI